MNNYIDITPIKENTHLKKYDTVKKDPLEIESATLINTKTESKRMVRNIKDRNMLLTRKNFNQPKTNNGERVKQRNDVKSNLVNSIKRPYSGLKKDLSCKTMDAVSNDTNQETSVDKVAKKVEAGGNNGVLNRKANSNQSIQGKTNNQVNLPPRKKSINNIQEVKI